MAAKHHTIKHHIFDLSHKGLNHAYRFSEENSPREPDLVEVKKHLGPHVFDLSHKDLSHVYRPGEGKASMRESDLIEVKKYLGASEVCLLHQVHSSIVVRVDKNHKTKIEADGSITTEPNLAIGVYTADCIPILLYDQEQTIVASLHCGWQGLVKGIIQNGAKELANLGKRDIKCIMGPSIGAQSYFVNKEHMDRMGSMDPNSIQFFKPFNDRLICDLRTYARFLLEQQGIQVVKSYDLDTCTHPELYPSFRRGNNEGYEESRRMLSAIMLSKS
jgi:polyphenol oxidase